MYHFDPLTVLTESYALNGFLSDDVHVTEI